MRNTIIQLFKHEACITRSIFVKSKSNILIFVLSGVANVLVLPSWLNFVLVKPLKNG